MYSLTVWKVSQLLADKSSLLFPKVVKGKGIYRSPHPFLTELYTTFAVRVAINQTNISLRAIIYKERVETKLMYMYMAQCFI